MNVDELVSTAKDSLSVRRLYGDPIERDGLTVVPVASLSGGLGGGAGKDATQGQEGEGGGFGMSGRPVGVYLLKDGQVTWSPAVDVNRVVGVVGLVVAAYLVTRPRMARARAGR